MRIAEYLSWNLDRPASEWQSRQAVLSREEYQGWYRAYSDDVIRRKIDFVHSLGLKCDSVGWCRLKLAAPDSQTVLGEVRRFCEREGWLARGWYGREYVEVESDWYELDLPAAGCDLGAPIDGRLWQREDCTIKAYTNKELPILSGWRNVPLVSEEFRRVCLEYDPAAADFCWVKDTGRYASGQYFSLYPRCSPPRLAWEGRLSYSDKEGSPTCRPHGPGSELYQRFAALGGWLPRLNELFYELTVHIPNCYPAAEMPQAGWAYAYWPIGQGPAERQFRPLIRRDMAETLMAEKLLQPQYLRPVLLYDEFPPGYEEIATLPFPSPPAERRAALEAEYEAFKKTKRPQRQATEKEALRLLRQAKHGRQAEFQPGMKRALVPSLAGTAYQPLASYYTVANGGQLSDEYELLSYEQALVASQEFQAETEREELLEEKPIGAVIARCPDGDWVLLNPAGQVIRFSHEAPEIVAEWPSPAQFFLDSIERE